MVHKENNSKAIAKEMMRLENLQKRKHIPETEYVTEMKDPDNILEIDDLHTSFYTDAGIVKAVNGVSISVPRGKTVGIVGESGCGKSVTSLSVMRLLQRPQGQISGGQIRYNLSQSSQAEVFGAEKAVDLAAAPLNVVRKLRGSEIAMIFQEPMNSLNPILTIGDQLDELVILHQPDWDMKQVKAHSIKMLEKVGIPMPEKIYDRYPHQLSGGMRQRVMIAMSLSCNPQLIIADEPTTALDVTIQAQILDLLRKVREDVGCSIMLITHDLGVVAEMADYIVVMYAGTVIEQGTAEDIFYNPRHPYTRGLLKSKPVVGRCTDELFSIPGHVPSLIDLPDWCYFGSRCDCSREKCHGAVPKLISISDTHKVACFCWERGAEK